jgi:hypothetical protein
MNIREIDRDTTTVIFYHFYSNFEDIIYIFIMINCKYIK